MFQFVPRPAADLAQRYKEYCIGNNLVLVSYFSIIAVLVFGLHLVHHLRLGMAVFSASMIPYTLLYSFNVFYAVVNLVVLPKMRDVPALRNISVLFEMSYPFFMGLVFTILALVGVAQEGGPIPFVAGMMVISVMLQGHFIALVVLLLTCWALLSIGIFYNLDFEQATSMVTICFSVVLAGSFIGRLTEKARVEQFEVMHELEQKNKLLATMSLNDPLTGLYNRKYFNELVEHEIARSMRYNHPLGLILINVDNLYQINIEHGHKLGDEVLIALAKLVKQHQREMDLVCRFNGDELCVLLVETNTTQALEVAQRILTLVQKHTFPLPQEQVTVSIGHTQYRAQPANKFIDEGYKMLSKAKALGKNQFISDSI
jgi:diguanylate cyclase (GGDEF)-like protein